MLTEQSAKQETVMIYQLLQQSLTEEPSSDPEEDVEDDGSEEEIWWHWNVRFQDIDELLGSLETMDALPVFCDQKFVDPDGIFDVTKARKAADGARSN